MKSAIKKMLYLFSKQDRKTLALMLVGISIMGIVEVISLASIFPFLAIVAKPEVIHTNSVLTKLYQTGQFSSDNGFLVFIGICVLSIIVLGNALSAFISWLVLRFQYMREHYFALHLFSRYLKQPYAYYLNQHTAEIRKNILTEIYRVVQGIFVPCTQIITKCVIVTCIISVLIITEPVLAFSIMLVIGGIYGLLYYLVKTKLSTIGKLTSNANAKRYEILDDAFSGIKEIKLYGRGEFFLKNYEHFSRMVCRCISISQITPQMIRYFIEAIAFGGMLLIVLYFLSSSKDLTQVLPYIGLYAFSGYRLMPAMQQIFTFMSEVRYNLPALDIVYNEFKMSESLEYLPTKSETSLKIHKEISLNNIDFTFPNSQNQIFKNFSLTIPANNIIGIVGSTGAGKTTLVDTILGLFNPDSGFLKVDDITINQNNLRSWQNNIGYVPQHIFLRDDTVLNNIAFALPKEKINKQAAIQAAKIANIHEFITESLVDGYETMIGESGIRLSGGQRQRLGIARALYHNPEVLILDEATSALDSHTENAIIEAINRLAGKKTIIVIAHRLTTLKSCDRIYILEKGEIVDEGKYDQLMMNSFHMKKLANMTEASIL